MPEPSESNDVSERKAAEEELRLSEQRFRSVWERSIDGMRLIDHAGRIIDVNEAYCQLVRLPRSRLMGELFSVTYADHAPDDGIEVYHRRFKSGTIVPRFTARIKLWNAQELDVEISNSFVELGHRGKLVLSIFRDISERTRTQERLEAAQRQLDHLLAESPAVIYSLRLTGERTVLVWISDYLEQLLGFKAVEACEEDWLARHVHPDDLQRVEEGIPEVLARRQIVREFRLRHKDGDYRWIRDEQRLVCDQSGQPIEIVGSWVEITAHKVLEEQFRQVQKMEAVGQLAGGVAHDFNNLLVVMRGNAELLLLNPAECSELTRESLKQITAAAERAANLTRQLLAFSRKQVMQSQPLALNDVIGNLSKMLNRIIGEHIQLQCQFGAGLAFVQADPGMIEQVLVNLVVNARDAMPQGGHLFIATEKVSITEAACRFNPEARPGEFVCLEVRDTGIGIAPENLSRIFEPFFTTKDLGKGTGLGLATVYGIVKQHRGWIDVHSRLGQGTTFTIFLPGIAPPAPKPESPAVEPPAPRGTESLLLVEDDHSVRITTRRVLESAGYTVHEAASAPEGIKVWQNRPGQIALLLTDILMPEGMSGRDLADELRKERPSLKVIFMSGYSPEIAGKDTEFFRLNQCQFLPKPCSSLKLLQAIRDALDGG